MAKVYKNDKAARDTKMTPSERLRHHQKHSLKIMRDLKIWMKEKLSKKEVEENSGLGYAIRYTLKRWGKLTLFLVKEGAPLDNNICERALKMAILTRKNSLFFKSKAGAQIGDIYMSIIHTCHHAKANPFEYLQAIMDHQDDVASQPSLWMPWNFKEALASRT
jgi:hypothetical protein